MVRWERFGLGRHFSIVEVQDVADMEARRSRLGRHLHVQQSATENNIISGLVIQKQSNCQKDFMLRPFKHLLTLHLP